MAIDPIDPLSLAWYSHDYDNNHDFDVGDDSLPELVASDSESESESESEQENEHDCDCNSLPDLIEVHSEPELEQ